MKKVLFTAIAASFLFLGACSEEGSFNENPNFPTFALAVEDSVGNNLLDTLNTFKGVWGEFPEGKSWVYYDLGNRLRVQQLITLLTEAVTPGLEAGRCAGAYAPAQKALYISWDTGELYERLAHKKEIGTYRTYMTSPAIFGDTLRHTFVTEWELQGSEADLLHLTFDGQEVPTEFFDGDCRIVRLRLP